MPYTIQGVNWSPASRGTNTTTVDPNNATVRRPEFGIWVNTDSALLEAMYANTVRVYIDPGFDQAGRAVLDELYRRDIMVIMTVDDANNDMQRVASVVNFYKDHPAILMWMLGSEWNLNRYFRPADFPTVLSAAQATQSAAALVKGLDTNHPVATSYGDININAPELRLVDTGNYVNNVVPSVDIWALNIYRGSTFGTVFSQWQSITSKPMFIGEFGTDAFRTTNPSSDPPQGVVDEAMQAQWDSALWADLANNLSATTPSKVAVGGLIFEFQDEWWKVQPPGSQQTGGFVSSGGHPDNFANEEFFGILDIDRRPRQAYTAFRSLFTPCAPRPSVRVATAVGGGALQTLITAGVGTLRSVQVGDPTQHPSVPMNASIDVAGGPTGMTGPFTYTPPVGTLKVSLTVRKSVNGTPTTVPLVVQDLCGVWNSFVGGGSNVP